MPTVLGQLLLHKAICKHMFILCKTTTQLLHFSSYGRCFQFCELLGNNAQILSSEAE